MVVIDEGGFETRPYETAMALSFRGWPPRAKSRNPWLHDHGPCDCAQGDTANALDGNNSIYRFLLWVW